MPPTPQAYQQLVALFRKVLIVRSVSSFLRWDSAVTMPSKGERLRAEQLGTLHEVSEGLVNSPKVKALLQKAQLHITALAPHEQRNLALMSHLYQRLSAQPARLMFKINHAIQRTRAAWEKARETENYAHYAPEFKALLALVKERAARLSDHLQVSPYEALIDEYDPGRKLHDVDSIFTTLQRHFPQLIHQAQLVNCEQRIHFSEKFDKRSQLSLCKELLRLLHFPLQHGRLDESLHPFTEGTYEDIRITTIIDRHNPLNTIMGLMHELGHALYDTALPQEYAYQLIGQDMGMVVHEAVALFWEKMIGTSYPFANWLAKQLHKHHSGISIEPEALYGQLNRVNPHNIRIDSDEVCYLAHILIRYQVEKAIFCDNLSVHDLPDFWQAQVKHTLGIELKNPALDCLQDIHWAEGYFGYFHTYALGFLFAGQLQQKLQQTHPDYFTQIANGQFLPLLIWFKENLFQKGNLAPADKVIHSLTGLHSFNEQPTLDYFKQKYQF